MRGVYALLLVMLAGAGGCAAWQHREPLSERPLALPDTPFFPQRDYQCGPAALATVLGAAGADVHPDQLIGSLYIPERHGTLQVELMAAARRRGFLAVRIEGTPAAIAAQLRAGRPVLVLQNLGLRIRPVWHYAVVVGYQPGDERFVLRSGREPEARMSRWRFEGAWSGADNWGLVVLRPDTAPVGLRPRDYLQAAADLENTGSHALALAAFRTAALAWPGEPTAHLGVANNLYYLGRYEQAAAAYRALLSRHPDQPVAVHNLVTLLLELGRPCEARAALAAAGSREGPLLETARRALQEAGPADCPTGPAQAGAGMAIPP